MLGDEANKSALLRAGKGKKHLRLTQRKKRKHKKSAAN
jgi:hypothetical protein